MLKTDFLMHFVLQYADIILKNKKEKEKLIISNFFYKT